MRFDRLARTLPVSALACVLPLAAAISRAQDGPAVQASVPSAASSESGGTMAVTMARALEATLPDAPGFASSSVEAEPGGGQNGSQPAAADQNTQPKRIFFILPNYRSVSAGVKLPAQSPKGKFITATQDTFDYSELVLTFLLAAYNYGESKTPEFGTGGVAYGRYLWHSYADQGVENYMVEFVVPSLTHEDIRYYTLGRGSVGKRLVYAVTRTVVTRSDSGHETFNAGEIVGAGLGAGISNLYYPSPERTVGNTMSTFGTNVGIDAASFVLREFDQDIYRKFARKHAAATP